MVQVNKANPVRRSRRLLLKAAEARLCKAKKNILGRKNRGLRHIQRYLQLGYPPISFIDNMSKETYNQHYSNKFPYTEIIASNISDAITEDICGLYDCDNRCIILSPGLSVKNMECTLVHELEHYRYSLMHGHIRNDPYEHIHLICCDEINAHAKEYLYTDGAFAIENMDALLNHMVTEYKDCFLRKHVSHSSSESHGIIKRILSEQNNSDLNT